MFVVPPNSCPFLVIKYHQISLKTFEPLSSKRLAQRLSIRAEFWGFCFSSGRHRDFESLQTAKIHPPDLWANSFGMLQGQSEPARWPEVDRCRKTSYSPPSRPRPQRTAWGKPSEVRTTPTKPTTGIPWITTLNKFKGYDILDYYSCTNRLPFGGALFLNPRIE